MEKGIRLYEIGIDKFLGNCLIHRLQDKQFTNVQQLQAELKPQTDIGPGKWADLAGLFAPEEAVAKIIDDIESGALGTLDQITAAFTSAHENYPAYEWAWATNIIQQQLGKTIDAIGPKDVIEMINKWKSAVIELDNMLSRPTPKRNLPKPSRPATASTAISPKEPRISQKSEAVLRQTPSRVKSNST